MASRRWLVCTTPVDFKLKALHIAYSWLVENDNANPIAEHVNAPPTGGPWHAFSEAINEFNIENLLWWRWYNAVRERGTPIVRAEITDDGVLPFWSDDLLE